MPIYASGELAKRTPEPTRAPANGNGSGVVRATADDAATICALATRAGIDDAALFDVLVTAGGGAPLNDAERPARGLTRALELLPLALVTTVCESLRERVGEAERATRRLAEPDTTAATGEQA